MYACVVKNSQDTWDIFNFLAYSSNQEKQDMLFNAVESGLPITGMIMTPHKWAATPGATFDGTEFTGGTVSVVSEEHDWETINTYGYICDNVCIGGFITTSGSDQDFQFQAAFADETTIVKIPEGQQANVGDIWDGEKVVKAV